VNAAFLESALRAATGDAGLHVLGATPQGGGIHAAARVDTSAGPFFAKWNREGPADQFRAEAAGYLVLEYLAPGAGGDAADERLGRGLAALHRSSASRFGFPRTTYCGGTAQDNRPADDWPTFYRDRRLLPLVEALGREGGLAASERALFDRLAARLPELVATDEPPALIHGDLWSGNVLRAQRGPALVDPSCAYAAREMEFGGATLFGGLSARAWAAYEEAWPLAPGWRERNPLYQLYHLLNHALLFGGGYAAQARDVARRFAR